MQSLFAHSNKTLKNQQGIALISALMIGFVSMLMISALLYMITNGTFISGSKTRYQMALESGHGGMNFFTKEIIQRGLSGADLSAVAGSFSGVVAPVATNAEFNAKLTTTGDITDGTYPNTLVDTTITFAYPVDAVITSPLDPLVVSTVIVSTSRGNSGTSTNLLGGGGVVNTTSGTITPQHIPYLYQTQTRAEKSTNPVENAQLSAVYAY